MSLGSVLKPLLSAVLGGVCLPMASTLPTQRVPAHLTTLQGFTPREQLHLPQDLADRRWTELRSTRYDGRGGARLFIVIPQADQAALGQVGVAFPDLARWAELTEEDGAILVIPDPGPDRCWDRKDLPYLEALYRHCEGYVIEGASRYLAAYGDGARVAAWFTLGQTSLLAGAAFVAPVLPELPNAPRSNVPLAVLMLQTQPGEVAPLVDHFRQVNETQESVSLGPGDVIHRRTGASPWNRDYAQSHFVRITATPSPSVPDFIYRELFRKVARWKTLVGEGTLRAKVRAGSLPGFVNLEERDTPFQGASVYVPPSLGSVPRRNPIPLVLILHGVTGNGAYFLDQTEWYRAADKHRFIVYAPTAPGHRWKTHPEDLALLARHLRRLGTQGLEVSGRTYAIDGSRIYLYGFSNGSFLGSAFILQHPELIAAAALWAGVKPPPQVPQDPRMALPIWYGIGTQDPYYPSWRADGLAFVASMCRWAKAKPIPTRILHQSLFGREGALTTWIHAGPRVEIRYSEAPLMEHGNLNEWPPRIWEDFFSRYRKVAGISVPRGQRFDGGKDLRSRSPVTSSSTPLSKPRTTPSSSSS